MPHDTSRGVALYGDKVYFAAGEAVLVALDAKTGKEVWTTKVADNKSGYYISLAPLVADGKVMVGASGGEFGIRGFVAAFDPETGKELWRTYTVPAPGEPGSETWPKGDQWKTGGGSGLGHRQLRSRDQPGVLGHRQRRPVDGRPAPGRQSLHLVHHRARCRHRQDQRPLSSTIPNDSWDWDEVSPPILVDYQRNGRTVKGLIDVARDGYLWFLERTRRPDQVRRRQAVREAERVQEPGSRRPAGPTSIPTHKPGTGKTADFCPSLLGRQELAADRVQPARRA